ncbi:MAG: glycosyltransferase [Clostridia bacterium]|nr:glycosyltransferase [Clostridia bacterium]
MQYGFLSTLIPASMDEKVRTLSSNNMQDAANAFQWHLYNGFCKNLCEKVELINILPIGSFPQYYKEPFIKEGVFATDYSDDNINVGFCNIKFLRKFLQPTKIYKALLRWYKKSDDEKTLFVYTVSSPFMKAVEKLKKNFPNVKVCAIIADLPDMTSLSSKKSMTQKLFEKFLASDSYSRIDCIDYFVLLTKHMADYMGIKKPFCVVEGISTHIDNIAFEKSDTKNILYTGTLHKRFGIMNLVSAFKMIDNEDYRLIICGIGDSKDEIMEEAKKDSRIIYKGQLPREEILKLQQRASCLVNPRQANEEFTKYSFPSKNLEYLSTGIPVVAYKLPGIPDEYDDYIFYVKDNSVEILKDKLLEVCRNETSAKEKAEKAKDFVLNNKNEVTQTKIILDMLR